MSEDDAFGDGKLQHEPEANHSVTEETFTIFKKISSV